MPVTRGGESTLPVILCVLRYIISRLGTELRSLELLYPSGELSPLPFVEALSLAIWEWGWGGELNINIGKLKLRKITYPRTYN